MASTSDTVQGAGSRTSPPLDSWPHGTSGTCVPGCELYGWCHCRCGERTSITPNSHAGRNLVRGRPYIYRTTHAPTSRAAWHALAGNGMQFHAHDIPRERVVPLVEFLRKHYGSLTKAAPEVGVCLATLCDIVSGRNGKWLVRPQTARLITDAVLALRPARRDPLATFDTEPSRQPTEWERERAEHYASAEYAYNRTLKKFAVNNQHDGTAALDKKARDRVYQRQRRAS